jgi:hypothetical protein
VRHVLRRRTLKRLIVTLKSGAAFDGVLFDHDSEAWVLRNAVAVAQGENGRDLVVDGELVLMVNEIDFAQRP